MGVAVGSTDSDIGHQRTYAEAMDLGQPFIRLKLDVHEPIALADFVGVFTAMGAEYDRYAKAAQPDGASAATLYVKHVRDGCIEADLVPVLTGPALLVGLGHANTVFNFVKNYGGRISEYLKKGGKAEDATKGELKHFSEQVSVIANAPGSSLRIAAMQVEKGEEKTTVTFQFDTGQAQQIQESVEVHKLELDHQARADKSRVLMVFTRSDVRSSALGKRSGEQVVIEDLSPSPRPLIYASDLAEQQIKHEITEAEDNVYKKGFVVDVNVQTRRGKPIAYSVTNIHQVIDLPDDGEA